MPFTPLSLPRTKWQCKNLHGLPIIRADVVWDNEQRPDLAEHEKSPDPYIEMIFAS